VSIDSLSGFNCFDTVSALNVWRKHDELYPTGNMRNQIQFKIWGKGCLAEKIEDEVGTKCFFKYQRQSFSVKGAIIEKEGMYGWIEKKQVKMIHHTMIYNEKGKLLFVEKKKMK